MIRLDILSNAVLTDKSSAVVCAMESPITRSCLELLHAFERMRPNILSYALQMERLRERQAAAGRYHLVEHEPIHVGWTEGPLRLRATCDTRTGELLAISVQPLPPPDGSVQLPALELDLVSAVRVDPAQVDLDL